MVVLAFYVLPYGTALSCYAPSAGFLHSYGLHRPQDPSLRFDFNSCLTQTFIMIYSYLCRDSSLFVASQTLVETRDSLDMPTKKRTNTWHIRLTTLERSRCCAVTSIRNVSNFEKYL
jgi:hypothetical protein